MKKLFKYPVIVVFGMLLYVIAIRDLFSPVRKTSELEKGNTNTNTKVIIDTNMSICFIFLKITFLFFIIK